MTAPLPATIREGELEARLDAAEALARQIAGTIELLASILIDGEIPATGDSEALELEDPCRSARAVLLLHRAISVPREEASADA